MHSLDRWEVIAPTDPTQSLDPDDGSPETNHVIHKVYQFADDDRFVPVHDKCWGMFQLALEHMRPTGSPPSSRVALGTIVRLLSDRAGSPEDDHYSEDIWNNTGGTDFDFGGGLCFPELYHGTTARDWGWCMADFTTLRDVHDWLLEHPPLIPEGGLKRPTPVMTPTLFPALVPIPFLASILKPNPKPVQLLKIQRAKQRKKEEAKQAAVTTTIENMVKEPLVRPLSLPAAILSQARPVVKRLPLAADTSPLRVLPPELLSEILTHLPRRSALDFRIAYRPAAATPLLQDFWRSQLLHEIPHLKSLDFLPDNVSRRTNWGAVFRILVRKYNPRMTLDRRDFFGMGKRRIQPLPGWLNRVRVWRVQCQIAEDCWRAETATPP